MDDAQLRAELSKLSDAADRLSSQSDATAGLFERVGKSMGMSAESISNTSFAMKQIGSGIVSFNRAISSSEVTFSKYNQTVTQVTGGLGGIFANFGPLGKALGAVTEVVGDLVGSVFKQNDQYLSAYDTLAKFGYAGEETADKLFDITKNTGFLDDKLTDLVSITTGLGNDLTYLGSTAGKGISTFFDIATISKEQRAAYIRLGYSQKEITQNQADYIKQQTMLGGIRTKDLKQLREGSLNYSKQLMELAALTGQTPEAIKAKQQEDLKDYAFNVFLRNEAKKAGKDGDKVTKRFTDGVRAVGADFDESTAKAFREILSTNLAQSDEAKAMIQTGGTAVYKWIKQFKSGEIDITEFSKRYTAAIESQEKNLGENAAINKELADNQGINVERNRATSKELNDQREKIVQDQVKSQMVPKEGGIKETQIKLIETQLEVQTAFQTLVKLIADYVNPAFTYLLKGLDQLTQGLMGTLAYLGVVDADFPYMFKDAGELNKILLEKQGRLVELQKDREVTTGLEAAGVDLNKPADAVKKAYVDQQIKLQEKEIDALKKRLKALTGSDRPAISAPVSTSGSANGTGGGDFSTTNNLNFGISSGSTEGYNGFLGDQLQAVVPLPDGKSIPVSFKNLPSELLSKRQNPLSQSDNIAGLLSGYASSMVSNLNQTNTVSFNQTTDNQSGIIDLISSKMDTLLDNISKNNQLQNDMLVYLKR